MYHPMGSMVIYVHDVDMAEELFLTVHPTKDCTKTTTEQAEVLARVLNDRNDLQRTFDFQWKADMRAIKRWQDAHPGNDHVWPDRANMVVWLMEQLEQAERGER